MAKCWHVICLSAVIFLATLTSSRAGCPENLPDLQPWGLLSTWGGAVAPSPGDNVTLKSGMRIILSSIEAPAQEPLTLGFVFIEENATLVISPLSKYPLLLRSKGIEVRGKLLAGSSDCPINTSTIIELYGDRLPLGSRGDPPPAIRKGVYAVGRGVVEFHGADVGKGWTRIASPHAAGSTHLFVRSGAEQWSPGSRIVVATTHFRDHAEYSENEERGIMAVLPHSDRADCVASAMVAGADASLCAISVLVLDQPLNYAHFAHKSDASYAAEVMLLNRTLIVRGSSDSDYTQQNPGADKCKVFHMSAPCADQAIDGDGGHMLAEGSMTHMHLSNVELYRMGQTNVRGRYPVHFHMMGESEGRASARSCSVHRSFYRCFVIHGTHAVMLDGNAAFDAIGNCFYLEDGVEERNILSRNLAMHVHFLISPETATPSNPWRTDRANLGFPVGIWTAAGQFQPNYMQIPGYLDQPADLTASGFYIPNLFNYIFNNAASGGWAGFSLPAMASPVGLHRSVDLAPNGRPPLLFSGNSAHSSGFWWAEAACIYAGGTVYEIPVATSNGTTYLPMYNPGRSTSVGLQPKSGPTGKTGTLEFSKFSNTTVAMSLNQGFKIWSGRSHISGLATYDTARGLSVLGDHHLSSIYIVCRSNNVPERWTELRSWHQELGFWESPYDGFSWYDQGQRHIVDGMEFQGCNEAQGLFVMWSGGDRAHAQVQMATRRVTYKDSNGSSTPPPENAIWWMRSTEPCAWDPNSTTVQQQWLQQNWIDLDGSASGRGRPTLIGSALAGVWWKLDSSCEKRWNMWLCDQVDRRWPAAVQLRWKVGLHTDSHFGYGTCGGSLWNCAPFTDCPQLGFVTHIGRPSGWLLSYDDRRLPLSDFEGVPITANGAITGPAGGLGWFVSLADGAPKELNISNSQVPGDNVTAVVIAIQYPPGTAFTIESRGATWCKNTFRTWGDMSQSRYCEWPHSAVATAEQVRNGRGDEYHFDGVHLYVRALPTSSYFDVPVGRSLNWESDVLLSSAERAYPYSFERSGVSIKIPACSEPAALCGTYVRVRANCQSSEEGGAYCDRGASLMPPHLGCPAGTELENGSFDKCIAAPSILPTPQPTPRSGVRVKVSSAIVLTGFADVHAFDEASGQQIVGAAIAASLLPYIGSSTKIDNVVAQFAGRRNVRRTLVESHAKRRISSNTMVNFDVSAHLSSVGESETFLSAVISTLSSAATNGALQLSILVSSCTVFLNASMPIFPSAESWPCCTFFRPKQLLPGNLLRSQGSSSMWLRQKVR